MTFDKLKIQGISITGESWHMKVLFISISTVPFGPNDLLFYRTAEDLLERGHDVIISPWDWKEKNAKQYSAISAKGAKIVWRKRSERKENFFARQLFKLVTHFRNPSLDWMFVEANQPTAIVISDAATYHFLSTPGLTTLLLESKIPYFIISQYNDENTSLPAQAFRLGRSVFRNARKILFVSQRNLEVARRQLCEKLENAVVVHNPPNLSDWSIINFPKDIPRFCMIARLECAVKGQALVLQALSEKPWTEREWRLDLYGQGPDAEYLRELISFLGLENKVSLQGFVTDVRGVWSTQQILIVASSGEGKPLALMEALLCGRPAVVTDVAGNTELVTDGENGFVAHSATLSGIREALERSWIHRDQWEIMGYKSHLKALQLLTPPPEAALSDIIIGSLVEPRHPQ